MLKRHKILLVSDKTQRKQQLWEEYKSKQTLKRNVIHREEKMFSRIIMRKENTNRTEKWRAVGQYIKTELAPEMWQNRGVTERVHQFGVYQATNDTEEF
jgi:hypothetical protein